MTPYPIRLERHLSPRIWGGSRLEGFLATALPTAAEPIGESWQVYADNPILNGAFAGKTLAEAAKEGGEALLGTLNVARYGQQVPLLAKFIDAQDRLSIQVHPDDAYAREREAHSGHLGKTEAWYILEAEPGATIIWGFKSRLDKEGMRRAIEEGTLEPHLNTVEVKAGDVVYNPAGTLHAIGAGIFLFEIQQSSDLTYRVYDYKRKDSNGNERELHVAKALDVVDLTPGESSRIAPRPLGEGRTMLVEVEAFAMERWDVKGEMTGEVSPSSFEILTATAGEMRLEAAGSQESLKQGESLVLPATLGAYRLTGEGTLLRCYVPQPVG